MSDEPNSMAKKYWCHIPSVWFRLFILSSWYFFCFFFLTSFSWKIVLFRSHSLSLVLSQLTIKTDNELRRRSIDVVWVALSFHIFCQIKKRNKFKSTVNSIAHFHWPATSRHTRHPLSIYSTPCSTRHLKIIQIRADDRNRFPLLPWLAFSYSRSLRLFRRRSLSFVLLFFFFF